MLHLISKKKLGVVPALALSASLHVGGFFGLQHWYGSGPKTEQAGTHSISGALPALISTPGADFYRDFYKPLPESELDMALEALEDQLPMDEAITYTFLNPEPAKEKEAPPALPEAEPEDDLFVQPQVQKQTEEEAVAVELLPDKADKADKAQDKQYLPATAQLPTQATMPEFSFPTTLPELRAAQKEFHTNLLADMNDDPAGQVDLDSMSFLDFFVNNWYYTYAAEQLEKNEPIHITPNMVYTQFDKIHAIADRYLKSHHTGVQQAKIMHAAIMSVMRGYDRDTWEFGKALYYGPLSCYSGTQAAVAGFDEKGIETHINVFDDHVQPAIPYEDGHVTIEFTTPVEVIQQHRRGVLLKPEAYVVGALLVKTNAELDDFPQEVQDWYTPWIGIFGLDKSDLDPSGLPPVDIISDVIKPKPGFLPFTSDPDFSDDVHITRDQGIDLTTADYGLSTREEAPKRTHKELEAIRQKHKTREEKLAEHVKKKLRDLNLFDQEKIATRVRERVHQNMVNIWYVADDAREQSKEVLGKVWFETYVNEFEPLTPYETSVAERTVLSASLRESHPENDTVGLLQNLTIPAAADGVMSLGFFKIPKADWCFIGEGILDNRVMLYGPALPDQVKGIHMRKKALDRIAFFTRLHCDLGDRAVYRAGLIKKSLNGETVTYEEKDGEFNWDYVGLHDDPLVDLDWMFDGGASDGVSLFAMEDLLSFTGEQDTIDTMIEYFQRDDLEMERVAYGRAMVALNNRLITHRDYFATKLGELMASDALDNAKTAAAQVLHATGSQDKRIPDTLAAYMQKQDRLSPEEVVMFAETGLGMKRARRIMRKKFDKAFDSLSHGHAAQLREKWEVEENKGRSFDEHSWVSLPDEIRKTKYRLKNTFDSLAKLGDTHGFRRYKKAFEEMVADGNKDKNKLFYHVDFAETLVTHNVFVDDVVQAYLDAEDQTEYMQGTTYTRSSSHPQGLVRWLHRAGHADKAVRMLQTIIDNEGLKFGYKARLGAAVTLHTLGEPDEARDAILDLLEEGCVSVSDQARKLYDPIKRNKLTWEQVVSLVQTQKPSHDGTDQVLRRFGDVRPALPALVLLAEMGLKKEHYDRLHDLAREGTMCFPRMYESNPGWFEGFFKEGVSSSGTIEDLRPIYTMLVKEDRREAVVRETQKYRPALEALGLLPDVLFEPHPEHIASAQNELFDLGHPKVRAQLNKIIRRSLPGNQLDRLTTLMDCKDLLLYYDLFTDLKPEDVNYIRACSAVWQKGSPGNLLNNDALTLLILKGHVGIDEVGTVRFYNTPQLQRDVVPYKTQKFTP